MGIAGISMRKAQVSDSRALARALGLCPAIAVIAGGMIGQSVFLVAGDMARALGSPTQVLAAWLCGGIVVLCGSFCYAELGAALPRAGGEYIYLSEGYGSLWGFLYGWASAVLMRPASCALISAGLLRFASFNYPSLSHPLFTWTVPAMAGAQPFQVRSAGPSWWRRVCCWCSRPSTVSAFAPEAGSKCVLRRSK